MRKKICISTFAIAVENVYEFLKQVIRIPSTRGVVTAGRALKR